MTAVSQSHHFGIETRNKDSFSSGNIALNRTILELKQSEFTVLSSARSSLNRTILELKQRRDIDNSSPGWPLNRTILELKLA